jgi:hypothetical protein
MPSFDPLASRPSAEVAAATEASQRLPTLAVLDSHSQQQPLRRIADTRGSHREDLAAMILELRANQAILDGLKRWFGLFVFTGGQVPTAEWNLAAMTSYLEQPVAASSLSAMDILRYQDLIQTVRELDQPHAGPRTLRCRHDQGARFGQAASEIQSLTDTLESSITKAMEGLPLPSGQAISCLPVGKTIR